MAGALDLHLLHGLSFHDALIAQAAIAGGCRQVLSEDMQYGARFGPLRVVDPFLDWEAERMSTIAAMPARTANGPC